MPEDIVPGISSAIWDIITTFNPTFANVGTLIYGALVLYRLSDFFLKVGAGKIGPGWEYDLRNLLMFIALVGAALVFYETPIPGVGYSVTNLVTGTTSSLAQSLDQDLIANMYKHWQAIQDSFVEPGLLEYVAAGEYLFVWVFIMFAKGFTIVLIALSLIFSALAALFGPLFIPWVLFPPAAHYFRNWRGAFIEWSFLQVSAYGYLYIFEHYVRTYLTTLPAKIPADQLGTYGIQAVIVAIVFCFGFLFIGVFNHGLFAGGNSSTIVDHTPLRRYV